MHYKYKEAVVACWTIRAAAREASLKRGSVDVGKRAEATSGKHMDPLQDVVAQIFIDSGVPEGNIRRNSRVEVPGYYRAEKKWDLVVMHQGVLIAAIELKSILGSFGNNLNNRAEEAIGNATDLLVAAEHGLLGPRDPWLGYVFVMQDEEKSRSPVRVYEPNYPVDPEFLEASYQKRAAMLCRRFLIKRLYSAAWFVTGKSDATIEGVSEPDAELTFAKFVAAIQGRVNVILA